MNINEYKKLTHSKFLYLLWIAVSQVKSKNKKYSISFMTKVSIVGVTIGVAVLIIVLSVMAGFEGDIKNKLLYGEPHLEVVSKDAAVGFSLISFPLSKMKSIFPEAKDLAEFVYADVVIKHKKSIQTAVLFGINPHNSSNKNIWAFANVLENSEIQKLSEKHYPTVNLGEYTDAKLPAIILGSSLALSLGADIGDVVSIINPKSSIESQNILESSVLVRHFVVVGIFDCGIANYDSKYAITSVDNARKFMLDYDSSLDEEEYVSGVAMKIKDPFKAYELEHRTKVLEGLKAVSWQSVNQSLLFALKLEKFTMGSILSLIIVVAAFSISGTLMMSVYYQRTHISLLRTLGMTKNDISKIFLLYGVIIGITGIVLGLALGLGVCYLIYNFKFLLPSKVYYLKFLPVQFLPLNYAVICCVAFIFVLIASLYPAFVASKQSPSEGLRYE